jgi:hypothetical protein
MVAAHVDAAVSVNGTHRPVSTSAIGKYGRAFFDKSGHTLRPIVERS